MFQGVLKLVEGIIRLKDRRVDARRSYFAEFVQPIFNDFEAVHQNYLHTIDHYRTMLASKEPLTVRHPVFDKIATDSLYSRDLRAKVRDASRENDSQLVERFTWGIMCYIGAMSSAVHLEKEALFECCGVRCTIHDRLKEFFSGKEQKAEKLARARSALDEIVAQVQESYGIVHSHFVRLKGELLSSEVTAS